MMIKAKFSNDVHRLLEPNIDVKGRDRWKARQNNLRLTTEQKAELFDKINDLHRQCSTELTSYQYEKRRKKRIQKARVNRGYQPKKKTTKAEWENMNDSKNAA